MFDLNVKHLTRTDNGRIGMIFFRCGCKMRSIGVGLVLRDCCRDHDPKGDKDAMPPDLRELVWDLDTHDMAGRVMGDLLDDLELATEPAEQQLLRRPQPEEPKPYDSYPTHIEESAWSRFWRWFNERRP